jgi:hypothetical protein
MRTVAAWALPIAKADTTAKAVNVRLKECMRMKKLLKKGWKRLKNHELHKAVFSGKACSIKLACKAAPKGRMSSLKS